MRLAKHWHGRVGYGAALRLLATRLLLILPVLVSADASANLDPVHNQRHQPTSGGPITPHRPQRLLFPQPQDKPQQRQQQQLSPTGRMVLAATPKANVTRAHNRSGETRSPLYSSTQDTYLQQFRQSRLQQQHQFMQRNYHQRAPLDKVTPRNLSMETQLGPSVSIEDRELLCLVNLYMSSYVSLDKEVDMNDRLVFFVPLIIIYWHHRRPHTPFPYSELDGMLRDIGQEGRVHRLVLQDLTKRMEANECKQPGLAANASRFVDESVSSARDQGEQANALKALQLLKAWLDLEDRRADEMADLTARQSGQARQLMHWFRDLFGHRSNSATSIMGRGRTQAGRAPTRGPTTPCSVVVVVAAAAPASTTTSSGTTVEPVSTSSPSSRDQARDQAGGGELAPETTTEPFGWPHYENRTDDFHLNERAIENSTLNLLNATMTNHELWSTSTTTLAPSGQSNAGTTTTTEPTPTIIPVSNEPVGPSTRPAAATSPSRIQVPAAPSHFSEFFYLATSILNEMNYNETAPIRS